jgi:hypothetical protein
MFLNVNNMSAQNIYIEILKFGRATEELRLSDVAKYLNDNNLQFTPGLATNTNTTLLINIFRNSFQSLDGKPGADSTGEFYYMKPEALAYLLSYEANEEARLLSNKAIKLATQSLWISAALAVMSIAVSIYFSLR